MNKKIESILKDIELNHNWSWIVELYYRNRGNLDLKAIFYRGNYITYRELFENIRKYAKALKAQGINQNDEVSMCLSNTPETIYILGAISMLGAKANIFGNEFSKGYIKSIMSDCSKKLFVVTDNMYDSIKDVVSENNFDKILMFSLADSLKDGIDPYADVDDKFMKFENKVNKYRASNDKIISGIEFINSGRSYSDDSIKFATSCKLDDEFLTTYSSGSTNSSEPKAITHANRSFIEMARNHDTDVSKSPSMKGMTVLAQIPTHSNTDIISSISDSLMQGSIVAMEPIYDKNFFPYSLFINKPTFCCATKFFWINAVKTYRKWKKELISQGKTKEASKINLSWMLAPMSVGEPLYIGEEKFLNKGLRELSTGTKLIPLPISPITMSVAGGDCEHGGIFFILFRKLQGYDFKNNEPAGLKSFGTVQYAVLDENGNHVPKNVKGRLVATSGCNMKRYKNNEEATKKFFIKDSNGKVWGNCSVYAYIDDFDRVHMLDRITELDKKVPNHVILKEIVKDTKNILSCQVVPINEYYVAHIELQPDARKSEAEVIMAAEERIKKNIPDFDMSNFYFRVRNNEESFPLTGCGKVSRNALIEEGITENCVKSLYFDGDKFLVTPFDMDEKVSKLLMKTLR